MPKITEDNSSNLSFPDIPSDEEHLDPEEEENEEEPEEDEENPAEDSVTKLLMQLKSSGAAVVKRVVPSLNKPIKSVPTFSSFSIIPPAEKLPHCNTCNEDFLDRWELNLHLIKHVKQPKIRLEKLPSDDEDDDEENQEDWSDEEDDQETEIPIKTNIGNAAVLQNLGMGISIKKAAEFPAVIKKVNIADLKNIVIKKQPVEQTAAVNDTQNQEQTKISASTMEKLSTAGSLKLTIKHSSTSRDDFQVVNNHKEIKAEPLAIPAANISTVPSNFTTATPTSNRRNTSDWDSLDIKEGILEQCQIKKEPTVPNNYQAIPSSTNPLIGMANMQTRIKNEFQPGSDSPGSPSDQIKVKSFAFEQEKEAKNVIEPSIPKPMVIPKKEPVSSVAIIEINGDDSDNDDIMFVDSTPAVPVDKKPPIGLPAPGKVLITELPSTPTSTQSSSMPRPSSVQRPPSTSTLTSTPSPHLSTEKQHNFNWNAPSKSLESMMSDKNTDAIFESLLASHRKDGNSDLGTSEYISLDTLGPQHTCEVCQTKYSDIRSLENHKRQTGHCTQIVLAGSSNALLPSFGNSGGFLNNFAGNPFKQLAETVGKFANANGSPNNRFSHQQNITVNFQAFPPTQGYIPGQQAGAPYPSLQPPGAAGGMPGYGPYPPNQPSYGAPGYGQYPPPYPPQPPGPYPPSYGTQMPYGQNPYGQPQGPGQMIPTSVPGQVPTSMPGQVPTSMHDQSGQQSPGKMGGIRIQNPQSPSASSKLQTAPGARLATSLQQPRGPLKVARGGGLQRGRGGPPRMPMRPMRPGAPLQGQAIRGGKPTMIRTPMKRPGAPNGAPGTPTKKRLDMLLPDRHDNEDCQIMSLQQQRDGLPLIGSIKGSKEPPVQLGCGLTVTKTRVRPPTPPPASKDAGAVASLLAQRGIRITAKPKSPSPPPVIIPNLGSAISITKKSTSSTFSIPEDVFDHSCTLCNKTFSNSSALNAHMSQMHPGSKTAKCDSCPVSYPSYQQLHEHKRLFHNSVSEMGLPVVDFSQQSNLRKLSSLGIFNFIPLANREQGNGCFGIPIVSIQNAMNGTLNNSLQALGAGGLLSLGPVKPLPKC